MKHGCFVKIYSDACQSTIFNASNSNVFDLNCIEDYGCQSSTIYCPYQEINACKITCADVTQSCYDMQIYVPDEFTFDFFNLNCGSVANDACTGLDVNCDSKPQITYIYNQSSTDWECDQQGLASCCPKYYGTPIICQQGQNCNIDCSSIDCNAAIINAVNASYLTINCGAYECENSQINCPNGGCSVNCIGTNACLDVTITSPQEDIPISSSVVSVDCIGGNACYGINIDAQYVETFDISCIAGSSSLSNICLESTITCPDNGCTINCHGHQACYDTTIQYSGELSDNGMISMNCTGTSACFRAIIEANDVAAMDLACNDGYQACNDMVINANNTKEFNMIINAGDCCTYMFDGTLNAFGAGKVNLEWNQRYAAAGQWNVENAELVTITARTAESYAANGNTLRADKAGSVILTFISAAGAYALSSNNYWYVPENTTINCHGQACFYLNDIYRYNIDSNTGLVINLEQCTSCVGISGCIQLLDIYCDYGSDTYSTDNLCDGNNICGCQDILTQTAANEISYEDMQCYTPINVTTCPSGSICDIACNADNVCGDVIDGSLATRLILNCSDYYGCKDRLILCPDGGCDIICDSQNVCDDVILQYDGDLTDNGIINIYCAGYYACHDFAINAEYIDEINIECRARNGYADYVCDTTLNANYANKVIINIYERYASHYDTWNVRYADYVQIFARSQSM